MKYFLRNQNRIIEEFGKRAFEGIIDSLEMYFKINMVLRTEQSDGEPFPHFTIPNSQITMKDVSFYVLRFDESICGYRLAFRGFIGVSDKVTPETLLEIFKSCTNGDFYTADQQDHLISASYGNDYPLQHGSGFTIRYSLKTGELTMPKRERKYYQKKIENLIDGLG